MQTTVFVIGNRDSLISSVGEQPNPFPYTIISEALRLSKSQPGEDHFFNRVQYFTKPLRVVNRTAKIFIVASKVQSLTKPFQYDNTILIYHSKGSVKSEFKNHRNKIRDTIRGLIIPEAGRMKDHGFPWRA